MSETANGRHLDLDVLADLEENIAAPVVEQAARAHLDVCPECRDRLAHLRTTRALLSTLPAEPMPEAVATRISAALGQAAAPASGTVVPINRRTRPWNSPAVAGAAAVAAVVVLIGGLIAGHVIHRGGKSASTAGAALGTTTRPKAADSTSTKEWATGANYNAATIATLVPRLVTGTPPTNPSFGTEAGGGANGSAGAAVTSGSAQAPKATAPTPGAITQEEMRSNPSAVAACATILADGVPTVPVAVDFASFEGKPAVIFALPAVGNTAHLDVWVVKSTCSASSLDVYFRRIPKPAG